MLLRGVLRTLIVVSSFTGSHTATAPCYAALLPQGPPVLRCMIEIRWQARAGRVRKGAQTLELEAALGRRQRSRDRAPVLDGEGEAQLSPVANRRTDVRWTLHLLADELKRRKIVHTVRNGAARCSKKRHAVANRCGAFRPSTRCLRVRHGAGPRACTPARTMRPTR